MIDHRISLARAARRTVEVTLAADVAAAPSQDLVFPVWTPGSYLVREHERHVHELRATLDDAPLAVEKVAKNVYRLRTAGRAGHLRVVWESYAHELTVRTSHADPSHAFLNPVALCGFLAGRDGEKQRLTVVDAPAGWGVACALDEEADGVFVAADYDELADSPLECGPHAVRAARTAFEVSGVRHELVFWGRSSLDRGRFTDDVCRIAQAQADLFGGVPYPRFLFIVHATDSGRGGLEHRASTALLFPRGSLHKSRGYEDLLSLASHELFHAWNVKRIKPEAFAPYDLTRENLTRQLWAFEGLTSYYEDLFLVRAGLMTRARYLEILAERMTQLERTPGRRRHPVEEASFDAWIRYYRQDENSDNSSVSYYLKGSLIGALADLEIRRATNGTKSLDDVLRRLWKEHGATGKGVPEGGVRRFIEEVGGATLAPLLENALRGTEDLPLEPALASHALKLVRRIAVGSDDKGGAVPSGTSLRCSVGLVLRSDGERVKVAQVRRDSPAEEAGLAPGDELIAIDGMRAETSSANARLHDREAGELVKVSLFRRDELIETTLRTVAPALDTFTIFDDAEAPAGARALLTGWLGGP